MVRRVAPWLIVLCACRGDAGERGPQGMPGEPGEPGVNGDPGTPGLACWDADGDGVADPEEDLDGNGVWDARDCDGGPGTPCWDTDADGVQDPAEDVNGDGAWNTADCAGGPGTPCWDLDADGVQDPAEDVNGDGAWNTADCAGGPGTPCWDLDADGVQDPAEDVNHDGAWNTADCAGNPGTSCWDLDADGVQDPAEDVNGDGAWNTADCTGDTTGTIRGVVTDAATGALITGATVTAQPLGVTATTGANGVFQFARAPFGVYSISATAPSLVVSGATVRTSLAVSDSESGVSLLAGQAVVVNLALPRLDLESFNLVAVHTGPGGIYTSANCEACHSNREAETSDNPAFPPYHALTTHAALSCTVCHANQVEITRGGWGNESAATLRKQVNVATVCLGCHPNYPQLP